MQKKLLYLVFLVHFLPITCSQTATDMSQMALNQFQPLMQGMSEKHPIMASFSKLATQVMMSTQLQTALIDFIKNAYNEGVKDGLMTAGTHMQATMNAMGTVVNQHTKK